MTVRWVVIIRNQDGGFRLQLRSRLAATLADMQSRRIDRLGTARRDAERLFGPLRWQAREDVGLGGQPYVEAVAEVEITGRE